MATLAKSVARRSHRKVRTGCGTCKRRKIKCDEQRPQCHNCARHEVSCTYANEDVEPVSPVVEPAATSTSSDSPTLPYRHSGHASTDHTVSVGSPLNTNSTHLRLLHHYTTSTSYTISADPLLRTLWRTEVPQLAFENEFLMRGIFALSAVHLSRLSPGKAEAYLSLARNEHHLGLLEASQLLCNVTPENCSALYAFSIVTFIYTWASPKSPGDIPLLSENGAAGWITLFRGIRAIADVSSGSLYNGPLAPLMSLGALRVQQTEQLRASPWWNETPEHAQLDQLRRHLAATVADPQVMAVYEQSLDELETCFCSSAVAVSDGGLGKDGTSPPSTSTPSSLRQRVPEPSSIYTWLYRASDKYLELVTQSQQEALVIFAHFCVVLRLLDTKWWMEGWCEHLLRAIWDLLKPEYRLWIQWPMEELGWTPDRG